MTGHAGFQPVIDASIRLAEKAAKEPRDLPASDRAAVDEGLIKKIEVRERRKNSGQMTGFKANLTRRAV